MSNGPEQILTGSLRSSPLCLEENCRTKAGGLVQACHLMPVVMRKDAKVCQVVITRVLLEGFGDFGATIEIGRRNKAGKMVSPPSHWGVLALNSVINLHGWMVKIYVSAIHPHCPVYDC